VSHVKIESRPLILVEAKIEAIDITECNILLQNAETFRLVCLPCQDKKARLFVPSRHCCISFK
jgi:3-dehydroquinate synthase class II